MSSTAFAQDTLETVEVLAAREPIDLLLTGSSVTVLDADFLAKRQTAALGEMLRTVPGVAMSRSGGFGSVSQLRMRGSEANHTLVFIDGIRANDPAQSGEFNFAHLLNTAIEAVEVIRGPQSSLWGSDAMAGVINVRTRRGTDGIDGDVFAEGGERGWRSLGASGNYGSEAVKAGFSLNQVETDGDNISRTGSEEDGYENTTASGNVRWIASDTLSVNSSLRYTDARNEFDNTDFAVGLPSDSDSQTDVEQLYGKVAVNLSTLGGRWRHVASLALTDTTNETTSENAFALTGFDQRASDAKLWVYTLQTSYDLAQGHTLTGAYEHWDEEFTQRGAASPFGDPNQDRSVTTDAFVLEYRGQLTDTVSVLASARNDYNSDFANVTTGRVSAAWQLLDSGSTLRAAWGTGVKNPTFNERFGFFTNFVGNPNLSPEESQSWEVGIDQRLLDNRLSLSATWFDEELRDEINGFAFDPAIGGFTAVNENGRSQRQGLELSGTWLMGGGLSAYASYTWLDTSEDDGSGGQVDEIRRAAHIASVNLNWDFADGRGYINVQVDYNGEQDDFFFPPTPPFQERVGLDAFTVLTLAGSYRVSNNVELYARLENATDERYEEILGFVAPGRMGIVGARYNFSN
ncbi:MAG: TonB-dependent receptor plug domain-containing protein [Congregibacter sp.]